LRGSACRGNSFDGLLSLFVVFGHEVENRGHDQYHRRQYAEVATGIHPWVD